MNSYVRTFVTWFLSGLGLALGVVVVVTGYDASHSSAASTASPSAKSKTAPYDEVWAMTDAVKVLNQEVVPFVSPLVVSGQLIVESDAPITYKLGIEVVRGNSVLYACEDNTTYEHSGGKSRKPKRFQVSCSSFYSVDRSRLPSDATIRIAVTRREQ